MTILATLTTTKTTSGQGASMMANAAAPPVRTRMKTAVDAFVDPIFGTRSAPAASPPPFAGPDDDDQSRQRTGDNKKVSRRWTKKREDRSGWLTAVVGCGKSGRWMARRATKDGGGWRMTQ